MSDTRANRIIYGLMINRIFLPLLWAMSSPTPYIFIGVKIIFVLTRPTSSSWLTAGYQTV